MLILVAVTVNVAVNSGLFGYAKNATSGWKEKEGEEANIGNGPVTINGKEYDSIDDYLKRVNGEITLPQGLIKQKGETVWDSNNGTASVELETTESLPAVVKIQYKINDETEWHDYSGTISGLKNNDFIELRLYDGINETTGESSITITDIEKPNNATIELSGTTTNPSTAITATVTHSDNKSGIDIENCKWAYTNSSAELGTTDSDLSKYTGTFASNGEKLTLDSSDLGDYYLHVLSTDRAGNRRETIITVRQLVTKVGLNKTTTTINVGETERLYSSITPNTATNKSVTWTSSDSGVATVDSMGRVTAKSLGTTIITVTSTDGSNKTATCTVTVENPLKVGDYVDYTPDTKGSYTLSKAVSGDSSDQSIPQEKLQWRIMSINEDGTVDLISSDNTTSKVSFGYEDGFNNGVYILNDLCKTLYSNTRLGATSRSLNLLDLETRYSLDGINYRNVFNESGTQYGKTKTYNGNSFLVPDIYEKVGKTPEDGSKDFYTTPSTSGFTSVGSQLLITQTDYSFDGNSWSFFEDRDFYGVVLDSLSSSWLATRSISAGDDEVYFGLFSLQYDRLCSYSLCYTRIPSGSSSGVRMSFEVRPVVSLGSDVAFSEEGGTPDNPRTLSK